MKLFLSLFILLFSLPAVAETPVVVVSIKPLHSLVQNVLGDTAEATLLIDNHQSPHGFALKPSQMKLLNDADVIFYIDDAFEGFLAKAKQALPYENAAYPLVPNAALQLMPVREGGMWEAHDHHDDHGHHHESLYNLHVWVSPKHAIGLVKAIQHKLSNRYPEHKATFDANAAATIERLAALDETIGTTLKDVKEAPFLVFHDAYVYFEAAYGLNGAGSITVEPDESPSAKRIMKIRDTVKERGIACVFKEPQYSDKLIQTVTEGSTAKVADIDALGMNIPPSKDLYFTLMEQLTQSFVSCLNP